MRGILYVDAPYAFWVFLFMTLILGGSAAWATGRALAKTWRPYAQILLYMLALAGAVRFLHYALFGENLLSLHYYLVTYAVVTLAASISFRRMRVQQMVTQYCFAFEPAGAFGWQAKQAGS